MEDWATAKCNEIYKDSIIAQWSETGVFLATDIIKRWAKFACAIKTVEDVERYLTGWDSELVRLYCDELLEVMIRTRPGASIAWQIRKDTRLAKKKMADEQKKKDKEAAVKAKIREEEQKSADKKAAIERKKVEDVIKLAKKEAEKEQKKLNRIAPAEQKRAGNVAIEIASQQGCILRSLGHH